MKYILKPLSRFFFQNSLPFILTFFYSTVLAQGNLLITPKRIIFDGLKRAEEINLANIGKDSATYMISFLQYKMNDDGKFEPVTAQDSTQKYADKNLRFFPRTVTLAPNEAQSVKVQLIKKNELLPGEYRSHLFFRAIVKPKPLGEEEVQKTDSVISIQLTPIFGISIPVIIRVGESSVKVNFSNESFAMENGSNPTLKITFNRMGNISSYGDLTVDYISPDNKIISVGLVKGIAVYIPNTKRNFSLLLSKIPGVDFKSGKLHIAYSDQAAVPGKICETEVTL
ncbi:MAG: hypothetical protein ABJA37_05755 [Ferruginibacter sp.]